MSSLLLIYHDAVSWGIIIMLQPRSRPEMSSWIRGPDQEVVVLVPSIDLGQTVPAVNALVASVAWQTGTSASPADTQRTVVVRRRYSDQTGIVPRRSARDSRSVSGPSTV